MIGKSINILSKIKFSNVLSLLIVILLFLIFNALSNINNNLQAIFNNTDATAWNTYGSLIYQVNNNNKSLDKEKLESIRQELNTFEKLIKK